MIFKQINEILTGKKTQTRRIAKPSESWAKALSLTIVGKGSGGWLETSPLYASNPVTNIASVYSGKRVKWRVGNTYAIVPKRGAAGIGQRIQIDALRLEYLQSITEADAQAEGVASVEEYKALWNSINGANSWNENPLVWVITFRMEKS